MDCIKFSGEISVGKALLGRYESSVKILCAFVSLSGLAFGDATQPIVGEGLVFSEKGGMVAIEAEHFTDQKLTEKRAWYLTTKDSTPKLEPDGDPSQVAGASGGAYLEILPDTRRNHGEKLIVGENFSNEPGKLAILSYPVHFETPGTYWLWARANSTTTEDNGLHFGIDGTWPETAQRWQTVIKNQWHWMSAQRTKKVHRGVPGILTLEVPSAGVHTIQVSMREDGIALDKILLVNRKDYTPEGLGPDSLAYAGELPEAFPFVKAESQKKGQEVPKKAQPKALSLPVASFPLEGTNYYLDQGKWAAINPDQHKAAIASTSFPFPAGRYDITIRSVGENDGRSTYTVLVNDEVLGVHSAPLSKESSEEGAKYYGSFKNVEVNPGDVIEVASAVDSADGKEFSRARWSGLSFMPADAATRKAVANYEAPVAEKALAKAESPDLQQPRQPDGDGSVAMSGELKQWHAVALTFDGPFAHELDNQPNPFTDYRFDVVFTHEAGAVVKVPGFFAADGDAGETSAQSGTKWRVYFSPNQTGKWSYQASFVTAPLLIDGNLEEAKEVSPLHGVTGSFAIAESDKQAPDFRGRGRLAYVGKHLLQFQGDKSYFLKAGADAPETFLGYADFDGTEALNPKKVPLKTWSAHIRDWQPGDPTWKDGKGKGMIGALNYLAEKGGNAFSFLPYNVDGDGSDVWPFVAPRDKFHYDCSKLDQWDIVFDHATAKGLYLHFKMQETEIDDNRGGKQGKEGIVIASLDGGKLGPERKLYCRELIARFGHHLALNWNLGEENTQSNEEQLAMANYIRETDPYKNHIVLHTYPKQQDKVYTPLLGNKALTGTLATE